MLTKQDIKDLAIKTGLVEEQVLQGLRKYNFDVNKFWHYLPVYKSMRVWPQD